MQRKPTRQSRGANAAEKRYMGWIKEQGICAACENDGGVYVHHLFGACWKSQKMHLGHLAVMGLCQCCDNIITRGSRRVFTDMFGPQVMLWAMQFERYPLKHEFDQLAVEAIIEYGK